MGHKKNTYNYGTFLRKVEGTTQDSRKTLDLGGKGGKSSGATKMCSLQTEKLSRNWQSRKMHWCLVQVPTVGKKLSRNRRRGDDCLYSMVPFRFSFSPMRGI